MTRTGQRWRCGAPGPDQRLAVRPATENDLTTLVDVDLRAFAEVYRHYGASRADLRQELLTVFRKRFATLGGTWIPVLTRGSETIGFIMCCPTANPPESFTTWEDMTDHGTLAATFDPAGKYLYVVTLSILPKMAHSGGHNMLFATVIGRLIRDGLEQAFFESRIPGLRRWALRHCRAQGVDLASLSPAERLRLATGYLARTRRVGDRLVPLDRLLRIYQAVGCQPIRLIPNAYRDEPSLDFGLLYVYPNPLPSWLSRAALARWALGGTMLAAGRRQLLAEPALALASRPQGPISGLRFG